MSHDYAAILEQIADHVATEDFGDARKADYIPALSDVPDDHFAMVICGTDGQEFTIGQADPKHFKNVRTCAGTARPWRPTLAGGAPRAIRVGV